MDAPTQAELQVRLDALRAKARERLDPVLDEIVGLLEGILIVAVALPAPKKKKPAPRKGRKRGPSK